MKYRDDFITPATKYDLVMESIARKDYFIWVKTNHHSLTVEETGLFVFKYFPFLVANLMVEFIVPVMEEVYWKLIVHPIIRKA